MSKQFPFFDFWEQFLTYSERERKMCLKDTMDGLRLTKEGSDVADDLQSKEWDFLGMVPSLFYFDSKSRKNDRKFLNFPFYTMLFSHKTLPLIALSNADLGSLKGRKTDFHAEGLSFWRDFESYTLKERTECHKEALDALSLFKKGRVSEEGKKLTDLFKSGKDYRFLGMVPLMYYFRVSSSSSDDLKALWEHPFSMFTMAYEHKSLPLIILCNANIEYNDSVLANIDGNKGLREMKDILGITG
jgi:hypothetical protein